MANDLTGKMWNLDTAAGLVTSSPVRIWCIRFTCSTVTTAAVILSTVGTGTSTQILRYQTSGSVPTAKAWCLTNEVIYYGDIFDGLRKITMTNVLNMQIVTF